MDLAQLKKQARPINNTPKFQFCSLPFLTHLSASLSRSIRSLPQSNPHHLSLTLVFFFSGHSVAADLVSNLFSFPSPNSPSLFLSTLLSLSYPPVAAALRRRLRYSSSSSPHVDAAVISGAEPSSARFPRSSSGSLSRYIYIYVYYF